MKLSTLYCVLSLLQAALSSPIGPSKQLEALHRRNVFYAGGEYVFNATQGGTILINQQYVEELIPAAGAKHPYPIVFFHGGGISGAQWLNKDDGNAGWASYFLNQGYVVYILDIWSVGRSSATDLPPVLDARTVELVEIAFSAPEVYKNYYQAQFHTQFPGTGLKGDPAFDDFYARLLPLQFNARQENITRTSTCALLQIIGPAFFISHSIGGSAAFLATDGCPTLVKGHVAVEADQAPFTSYDTSVVGANMSSPARAYGIADVPLTYDPPVTDPSQLVQKMTGQLQYKDGLLFRYPCIKQGAPVHKLVNIAQAPVLFLTTQASVHILFDQCLVQFLEQAGVNVNFTKLADIGIEGNGHFSMLENNSDSIATYILSWLVTHE
ncbi:hypothetical protein OEA41_007590 [Lepraria neglecta]|uniref:AB hydrolase-1 domain-containing protein n=1 Tax=Lepraria neglecta TaxID=209136 RepID=A0AAD9ZDE2_9LECA|nr:hypothetical protein OEA41_007590 [Lepraria neglecta]